jgi:hypothetical protein
MGFMTEIANFLDEIVLHYIAIYLSQGLHEGFLTASYRRTLQPSKENIQHVMTISFFTFSFLWVIFAHLVPVLQPKGIRIHAGSASDPQHFPCL